MPFPGLCVNILQNSDGQKTILVNTSVARQKVDLRRIFHFEARTDTQTYREFINLFSIYARSCPVRFKFRYDRKTAFKASLFHFNRIVTYRIAFSFVSKSLVPILCSGNSQFSTSTVPYRTVPYRTVPYRTETYW